jgi:hypothetical protein
LFSTSYDESLATLKFADRAKNIFSVVKPNEILAFDENLISKLTAEVNSLKEILSIRKRKGIISDFEEKFLKLQVK